MCLDATVWQKIERGLKARDYIRSTADIMSYPK
jgi:hypothetical protein